MEFKEKISTFFDLNFYYFRGKFIKTHIFYGELNFFNHFENIRFKKNLFWLNILIVKLGIKELFGLHKIVH